ncbi:type II toxin-antitoxin system HicA family toxin [Gloeomargarita lithophora]|uniref:type II toxin-antitoxin system HicA family toxin n=1 Tax=Gloeomargarita lithophora TaxID=1188228 RepID=UPI0035267E2B
MLLKFGFLCEGGKGSHTKWSHPLLSQKIILSGHDGTDAKPYQEKDVNRIIQELRKKTRRLNNGTTLQYSHSMVRSRPLLHCLFTRMG